MTGAGPKSGRAAVIGSGVGGLTAGIILAKIGYQVTVVEKNRKPGGLMRGYSRKGVDCPVGVHYLSALGENEPLGRVWDYLGIRDKIPVVPMGAAGVIDRYLFDDFSFDLPPGLDAFEHGLVSGFPGERTRIGVIMEKLRAGAAQMATLESVMAPEVSPGIEAMEATGGFLSGLGVSPRLYRVMGVSSFLIGVPVEECPIWLHFSTLGTYLTSAWRLKTGSTDMAEAYAARLTELGGRIMCGSRVSEILVDGKRAVGLKLESGQSLAADYVLAGIHPKALLGLLPPAAVKPAYQKRIVHLEESPGVFCVQAVVDASALPAMPHNVYRLKGSGGKDQVVYFFQVRAAGHPGVNLLTAIKSSPYQQWAGWEKTVSGRRGPEYLAAKEEETRGILEEAERIFKTGDFRVLDSFSPLTLRDWVETCDGAPYGLKRSSRQMSTVFRLSRLGVGGLQLVGQNVLAPGIMGVSLGALRAIGLLLGQETFQKKILPGLLNI